MSTKDQSISVEPQEQATDDGVDTKLNSKSLDNFVGFLDVLIQMDFKQQSKNNERIKNEEFLQNNTEDPTQSD